MQVSASRCSTTKRSVMHCVEFAALLTFVCFHPFSRWPVRTISFNHDGQYIASASEDLFIDIVSFLNLAIEESRSFGEDEPLKQYNSALSCSFSECENMRLSSWLMVRYVHSSHGSSLSLCIRKSSCSVVRICSHAHVTLL